MKQKITWYLFFFLNILNVTIKNKISFENGPWGDRVLLARADPIHLEDPFFAGNVDQMIS